MRDGHVHAPWENHSKSAAEQASIMCGMIVDLVIVDASCAADFHAIATTNVYLIVTNFAAYRIVVC